MYKFVLTFYWVEEEDRPWEMLDVAPPKYRWREESTTSERVASHNVLLN